MKLRLLEALIVNVFVLFRTQAYSKKDYELYDYDKHLSMHNHEMRMRESAYFRQINHHYFQTGHSIENHKDVSDFMQSKLSNNHP